MKNACGIINNGLVDLKFKTYGARNIYVYEDNVRENKCGIH